MNVYMPNKQEEKIDTINKIKDHIKKLGNPNNLMITENFNFVTDILDRSPVRTLDHKVNMYFNL